MDVTNIKEGDSITFIEDVGKRQDYQGCVLGAEGDIVWVIVPALKDVFEFNTINIFTDQGEKLFRIYDRRRSINFAINGVASDDIHARFFENAKNEKNLIKLMRMYKLVCI